MINIVLVEPEIPQNAGNVLRTAAVTGCHVYFVKPLGFELTDKHLKRAGMDYISHSDFDIIESLDELITAHPDGKFFFATTKAKHRYDQVSYPDGAFVVFGKESFGLPERVIKANYNSSIRIPMLSFARSLNLSNSVAIITYEALRQQGFSGFKTEGELTGRID